MSPLLGRPALTGRHVLLRSLLLLLALLMATAPLSALLAGDSWLTLTATGVIPVIVVGAAARLITRRFLVAPAVQLLAIVLLVLVLQWQQGLIRLLDGPITILQAQSELFTAGIYEIGSGVAPMALGVRGTVIVVLMMALVAFVLDRLYVDLGWHTPTSLILLSFLLVPALQQPEGGAWWTASGPVLAGLLIFAARTLHADPRHLQGDRRPQGGPHPAPVRTTAAALLVSVLIAGMAIPAGRALPVLAEPVVALNIDVVNQWRNRDLPRFGAVMIDDDVSVRRSLLSQEPVEVLRYTTDAEQPPYLRLRTLNSFDGEAFRASGDPSRIETREGAPPFSDASVDGTGRSGDPELTLTHDVIIESLGGDRLPVPENLRTLEFETAGGLTADAVPSRGEVALSADAENGGGGLSGFQGVQYTMLSEQNPATADDLRAVTDPAAFADPFESGYIDIAQVPAGIEDLAGGIAAEAEAANAYDTAVAYQEYFRTNFDYSLTVRTPLGADPLESFLADRIGYCEQFAATFALMMTSQGYPTRVVIGFTGGQADGSDRVVSSTNAHAWPEVWFGPEHGWIRFEPTPAAAANGVSVPAVTDPAAEDTPEDPPAEEEPTEAPTEETTSTEDDEDETTTEEDSEDPTSEQASASDAGGAAGDVQAPTLGDAARAALTLIAIAAVGFGLIAIAVVLLRQRRTRRRERRWTELLASCPPGGGGAGGGGTGGGGMGGDGSGGAAGGGVGGLTGETSIEQQRIQQEQLRRRAGELALSEIRSELRARDLALRTLGWTGAWGWPPRRLRLDPSVPVGRALQDVVAIIEVGQPEGYRTPQVTDAHRQAAARIADAVSDSRYAPPLAEPSTPAATTGTNSGAASPRPGVGAGTGSPGAEETTGSPRPGVGGDCPRAGEGTGSPRPGGPTPAHHPLRDNADLLIDLIRRAR